MVPSRITITVDVIPRGKKTELVAEGTDYMKIRLHAIPEKGKANDELIDFLATHFKIAKSNIAITHGLTAKRKKVTIMLT